MRSYLVFYLLVLGVSGLQVRAQDTRLALSAGPVAYSFQTDLQPKLGKWSGGFKIGLDLHTESAFNPSINAFIGQASFATDPFSANDSLIIPAQVVNQFYGLSLRPGFLFNRERILRFAIQPSINLLLFNLQDEEGNSLLDRPVSRADRANVNGVSAGFGLHVGPVLQFENGFGAAFKLGYTLTASDYLDNTSPITEESGLNGVDRYLSLEVELHIPLQFY